MSESPAAFQEPTQLTIDNWNVQARCRVLQVRLRLWTLAQAEEASAGPPDIFGSRSLAVHSDSIPTTVFSRKAWRRETASLPVRLFTSRSTRMPNKGAHPTVRAASHEKHLKKKIRVGGDSVYIA
jgi:hypothetical protein